MLEAVQGLHVNRVLVGADSPRHVGNMKAKAMQCNTL